MVPAAARGSAALLQALSRGPHRQLRRPQDPRSVLPLRQPVRLQPQLPVRLGAGARAGGRGRLSRQRARDARHPRLRHRASRDLRVAEPPHVRRRADPPARRPARPQDGPGRPRGLPPGRGVDEGAHRLSHGERLPRVPLRARDAAEGRPLRVHVQPARLPRVRDRAVGPLPPDRRRAEEAVRRRLQPARPQGLRRAREVGPRRERGPRVPQVAQGQAPAAGRGGGGRARPRSSASRIRPTRSSPRSARSRAPPSCAWPPSGPA